MQREGDRAFPLFREGDRAFPLFNYKSLSHSVWECKYHIVFIPKYRKKKIY